MGPERTATTLVVGHNTMFPRDVWGRRDLHVHTFLSERSLTASLFTIADSPTRVPADPAPWINASLDSQGRPSVWRVDVAASRSWWTANLPDHTVWPQALVLNCNGDVRGTLMATRGDRLG